MMTRLEKYLLERLEEIKSLGYATPFNKHELGRVMLQITAIAEDCLLAAARRNGAQAPERAQLSQILPPRKP